MEINHYINTLNFKYFETYSLLRGKKYDDYKNNILREIVSLKEKTKKPAFGWYQQNKTLHQLELLLQNENLLNEDGSFHPSSEKITTITKGSLLHQNFLDIFQQKHYEIDFARPCAPIFRDAIIFYDTNNTMLSILNICFECGKIRLNNQNHTDIHFETYLKLRNFFILIGHKLEEE